MTPEKYIPPDFQVHVANSPWYYAAFFLIVGKIGEKLEPVPMKLLVSILILVIGGLGGLGIQQVLSRMDRYEAKLEAYMTAQSNLNHVQDLTLKEHDLCIKGIQAWLDRAHPEKKPRFGAGDFGKE